LCKPCQAALLAALVLLAMAAMALFTVTSGFTQAALVAGAPLEHQAHWVAKAATVHMAVVVVVVATQEQAQQAATAATAAKVC
jgi:hypothetical protein